MSFPWIVPTIDEPMSSYTAMAFSLMFVAAPILAGFAYNWMKREFKSINDKIDKHDRFITQTSKDISTLKKDVAVLIERSAQTQKNDESMQNSIDDLQHTLRECLKR